MGGERLPPESKQQALPSLQGEGAGVGSISVTIHDCFRYDENVSAKVRKFDRNTKKKEYFF
jgi:hypothetical protein